VELAEIGGARTARAAGTCGRIAGVADEQVDLNKPVEARAVPEHWLDKTLRVMGSGRPASEQMEMVWQAYEVTTATELGRPPTSAERAAVHRWSLEPGKDDNWPGLIGKRAVLTPTVHRTVSSKASSITQLGCRVHSGDEVQDGLGPIFFPVGIEPWSAQSAKEKVAIRTAVGEAMRKQRRERLPWGRSPLCVTIAAVVPRKSVTHRRKDVDNLVKGLLDAMAGTLYVEQIVCLTVRRLEYAGPTGRYYVHAMSVLPWTHDVIFDDPRPPYLSSGEVKWPPEAHDLGEVSGEV